jgi:predicted HTH transcriptional regulator
MSNTQRGGIVFYGIDNDGNIEGSDVSQQKFDQPLQNSIRNSISPATTVRLHSVHVMGSEIIVIIVPPWNRKDVYQFEEKILLRKGTNVFGAKPEEVKLLHAGQYVI